jgi:hypothetical protein
MLILNPPLFYPKSSFFFTPPQSLQCQPPKSPQGGTLNPISFLSPALREMPACR